MEHAALKADVDENGMVSFGIDEDAADVIADELGAHVSTAFDPNFEGVDEFEILVPFDVIENLPNGLGAFQLIVTDVVVDRLTTPTRLALNAMQYRWSDEMKTMLPQNYTFTLGNIEGAVTPSMMLVQKKIKAALEDVLLTFVR